jgi:hypothetical protein
MPSCCSGVSGLLWVYGDHMLRPRARVARPAAVVPPRARVEGLVAVVLLALVLGVSGCGSDGNGGKTDGPSKEAVACRKEWKALEKKVEGRDAKTNPSALAARWNSIAATIDYYATSGSAEDCNKALGDQEKAMDALDAFGTKLAAYDMELRLDKVTDDARAYASAPQRPAPSASPSASPSPKGTKKGQKQDKKKQKPPPLPPKPADVAAALKTLTQQAPLATQQQGPGWQQADVTELGDTAAVTKSVADLAFLSSESPAYRACTTALTLITTALSAK